MATPVVAGAAAIMLQKDPSLSPDTVKARLMKTANKTFPVYSTATDPTTGQTYLSTYDVFTVGAGYINLAAALTDYEVATKSAASPPVCICLRLILVCSTCSRQRCGTPRMRGPKTWCGARRSSDSERSGMPEMFG